MAQSGQAVQINDRNSLFVVRVDKKFAGEFEVCDGRRMIRASKELRLDGCLRQPDEGGAQWTLAGLQKGLALRQPEICAIIRQRCRL